MREVMVPGMPHELAPQWLCEKEVAKIIGMSVSTLQKKRFHGSGLPYAKLGRAVRYRLSDVQAYMEAHMVKPHNVGIPALYEQGKP